MQEETQGRSAKDLILEIWSRRKWLAIAAFVAPLVCTVSLLSFLPNIYRSSVTVLVDRQQVPEAFVRPTVTSVLEVRLQTISQEILSRPRLNDLIARFGLYGDLKKQVQSEEVIERMRRDIGLDVRSVEQREGRGATVAFALSYRGRDPQTVAQVANALASFYIEENLRVRERQAAGTSEFLKIQLASVRGRLDQQEQRVSEFKRKHLGELPQHLDANLSTVERLNGQVRANADMQLRANDRRDALLKQLADAGALDAGPETIEEQLAKLSQELVSLRARFSDKYPDVTQTRDQIAALERQLREATRNGAPKERKPTAAAAVARNPSVLRAKQALADVETELGLLKREEKQLRSAITAYVGRVENIPRVEQEFIELSRDYESTRELYGTLMKRYDEAQLAENMEQRQKGEQFRVLESAVPGQAAVAPNRMRLMIMGVALSLGVAVAAVLGAEQLNAAFHSLDDLRGFTSVPVLVSIPRIVTAADTARGRRWAQLAAVTSVVGVVLIVGVCYLIAHNNEQLVALVTPRA